MLTSFAFSQSIPGARPSHRIILLSLVLIKLLTSGCATTPGKSRTVQTATVISYAGNASGELTLSPNLYFGGSNPKKIRCQSREEALQLGKSVAGKTGANLLVTSGTKSMEPLIHGRSYVVVQPRPYHSISKGDLLVYQGRPDASKQERVCMLHRAVLQDKGGWLMSGDSNRWTESWDRVTPDTYQGTVTTILEFPQT